MRGPSSFVVFLFALGCATTSEGELGRAIEGPAIEEWDIASRAAPSTIARTSDDPSDVAAEPIDRFQTRRIAHSSGRETFAPHLGAGPRVDVRFHRAPLSDVLRMLAETANLGLVVGEGVEVPITVELRRVGAITAMRAVAEAHEIELDVVGRTVIARRR